MGWISSSISDQLIIVGQVALAMLLAGAIGFERETKDQPAGFRTLILVGGSSALFVALGDVVTKQMVAALGKDLVRIDPVRILQAILTGISFLGAGTILRRNDQKEVHGLTTAASILFVSGIGVTVASGAYVLAVLLTLLVLFVLHVLHRFEQRINPDQQDKS